MVKCNFARLLQILIVFFGLITLAFLLIEPHFEGRNANATFLDVYLNDPFLVFVYAASAPFFAILYNIYALLQNSGPELQNSGPDRTSLALSALRTIQNCSIVSIVFVLLGATWLLQNESDDKPPIIMISTIFVMIFFSLYVASGKICTRFVKN